LTSSTSVLAALAIILVDLFGRAGLDKVLALTGGPDRVALWAQLQSVVELVSTVAIVGVLQGLTVLVAQTGDPRAERGLLREALRLGLATSLAVALVAPALAAWLTQEKIGLDLFVLAALAGLFTVVPATLNAYWLGKHMQRRMLGLALLSGAALLMVAAGAWLGLPLRELMLLQCLALLLFAGATWRYLRKLAQEGGSREGDKEHFRKLASFVPVGLAIGIMSPVSMLVVRGLLSGMLSWNEVGLLQALWRSAEWVTATAAGVMTLVFLPRLSASHGSAQFNRELARAGMIVLAASACLLLLIYFNQRAMLATLYDARFAVSDEAAALIMLGSLVRVASWLFLFGLYAASRTRLIVVGEVLSLPLFALLLWLFAGGMTLERASLLYLASYIVYLGFNAAALHWPLRHSGRESAEE
jgi:O-antigen/teichoic acid export membrane protein